MGPGVCKVTTCPGCPIPPGHPPESLRQPPKPTLVITAFPVTEGITSATLHPHFMGLFLAYVNPWGPFLDPSPPPHAVPSSWPYLCTPAPPWRGGKRGAVGLAPRQREAPCRRVRGPGSAPPAAAAGSLLHGAEPGGGNALGLAGSVWCGKSPPSKANVLPLAGFVWLEMALCG